MAVWLKKLMDDEDARACKDISDQACHHQPRSFLIHIVALSLTKTGDGLIDPKLTLTWLLGALGAPLGLTAWLVPVRESLSLLPQLAIASELRKRPIRKTFWVVGSVVQGLCILAMAWVAFCLKGELAGISILALLAGFSLARGVCSVAIKDVQGKTIAKNQRGKVSGYAASVAGASVIVLGLAVAFGWFNSPGSALLGSLLVLAGLLWLVAAAVYQQLPEYEGATEGGKNGLKTAVKGFLTAMKNSRFRRFLFTRTLLLASALMTPFLVAMAGKNNQHIETLGVLLLASGLASFLSGPIWGRFADRSSRLVMCVAAMLTALTGLITWLLGASGNNWGFAIMIFAISVAHAGVRLGRKTYLIDMANSENRATLVALSNTAIGIMLLVIGGLTAAIAQYLDAQWLVLMLSVLALLAAVSAWFMDEA
ncbi:MFS transporter [Gallaecimonas mangrovi]|uniref:MFS transporter n=1 Tax=Gallaecimonas mangrovi TaxID=2291597 RepID=UPI000E208421|nr:MFS transporter [Gallaecimonas mangrovi]